ncbi:MAG: hypothetical protein JWQ98_1178 [Chlorobi bacterium]|nr:hypothetical protein [Chlorobiota bacterium]
MATNGGGIVSGESMDAMGDVLMEQQVEAFPFITALSLAPLIRFWDQGGTGPGAVRPEVLRALRKDLQGAPELLEPIIDATVLDRHRETVEKLMSIVFPPTFWERDISAAFHPYGFRKFYATPAFDRLFEDIDGTFAPRMEESKRNRGMDRGTSAYFMIAKKLYGFDIDTDYSLVIGLADAGTGLDRYYKVSFDSRFLDVVVIGDLPALSPEERARLLAEPNNNALWRTLLPPERFQFHGFMIINAVDVTEQEALSILRRDLVENDSLSSRERFTELQTRVRTILGKPEISLGLSAVHGDQVLLLNTHRKSDNRCIFTDSVRYRLADFNGSIYERALRSGQIQFIDDLRTWPDRTEMEENTLAKGYANMCVAPLRDRDSVVGLLYILSPVPGDINRINALRLNEVLPLFAIAVKRSIEELNNRVQRIIREEYTAIHPSVEWRFRKAALNIIARQDSGAEVTLEPILFNGVYPLYNVTDVRGSSTQRNLAIQQDLVSQLKLAREVMRSARRDRALSILSHLAFRIERHITAIEKGLGAGDEANVLAFLQEEVEPLFDHLETFGDGAARGVAAYRAAIEPGLGILYDRRRQYEESMAQINRTCAAYIEAEEDRAQNIFPHYFEKHETDGIDMSIYVGAPLVEHGTFDPLYLRELRLWQLMVMCGLARAGEKIKPRLSVPLDTTHLVLVQHTPLSIRFRLDEKQFDVDGAYNIRYEIIKKRIDKATIKGTSERLTQPGKIAIVYSQGREAQEYTEYIEFLVASGYLAEGVEEVDLEDLQGVQGLKALRVTVRMDTIDEAMESIPAQISEAIRSIASVTA